MFRSLFRCAAAVVFGAAALPAAAVAQDYSYAFRVTPSDGEPFAGTVRVSGTRARIDAARTDDHGEEPRDYLLLSDEGRTITVVRPRDQSYSVSDARAFEQIAGTALRAVNVAMSTRLDDVRIGSERLGPGDTIAGFPTQRYRLTQEYTATIGVMGMKGDPEQHVVITDFWVAPGLELMRNPLVEMLATTQTVLAQSDASFAARSAQARDRLFRGMPLRLIVAARSSDDGHDNDAPSRLLVEVTRVVRGPVDRAALDVPSRYRKETKSFSFQMGK
jgi:hypothetical protein